jgi:hypothetical protein
VSYLLKIDRTGSSFSRLLSDDNRSISSLRVADKKNLFKPL